MRAAPPGRSITSGSKRAASAASDAGRAREVVEAMAAHIVARTGPAGIGVLPTGAPPTLARAVSPPPPPTPVRSTSVHWWGTRTARFGMLLVGLAVLLLAPIHLDSDSALWVGIGGLLALALLALARVRRLVARIRDRTVNELHVLGRAVPSPAVVRDIRTFDSVVRAV